jgi:hypothetical protein
MAPIYQSVTEFTARRFKNYFNRRDFIIIAKTIEDFKDSLFYKVSNAGITNERANLIYLYLIYGYAQ